MKYSLRSLMIVAMLGPPLLAWGVSILPRLAETFWPRPTVIIVLSGEELGCMRLRLLPDSLAPAQKLPATLTP